MTILIDEIYRRFQACSGISIDSRTIQNNDCFFALKGARFNGNKYVQEAFNKGATLAIVDQDQPISHQASCIRVKNTLETLQKLAAYHRLQTSQTKWIVIGGSNGKTTSKELCKSVLSQRYQTWATIGNYNNHIGVPVSMLQVKPNTEVAIIEIGANHIGEHRQLCEWIQPDYGVITNCGKDHLEGYGSYEAVIQSNKEIYDYFEANNKGHVFVNAADPLLVDMVNQERAIFYGNDQVFGTIVSVKCHKSEPLLSVILEDQDNNNILVNTQLYGQYNLQNIALAAGMGKWFGIELRQIGLAIEAYQPNNYRSQIIEWNGATVYLDAYNANPTSMMNFLEFIESRGDTKKMIVLGSMAELGTFSKQEHQKIIKKLNQIEAQQIILVGEGFKAFQSDRFQWVESYKKVNPHWQQTIDTKGAEIFVKGSRSYTLEKIFE